MDKYLKLIVAVFALCIFGVRLHAQSFQWVHQAGPTSEDSYLSITSPSRIFTDSKENVYFCFDFEGVNDLTIAGERVFISEGLGHRCGGVACYDCQGGLKWYRTFFGKKKWGNYYNTFLNTAAMVNDTLIFWFYGIFDSVYVCDSSQVLDKVACNPNYALWLSTDSGRAIRTAHTGALLQMQYYNNRLHVLGGCSAYDTIPGMMDDSVYIQIFTPQGEKIRHLSLDYSSYPEAGHQFAVYHDKYYVLYPMGLTDSCRFGEQQYTGYDTLAGNTVFACFDSTGRCLWSRLLNSHLPLYERVSKITIDTLTGLIYLAGLGWPYGPNMAPNMATFDGDTLWSDEDSYGLLILACYDTLGNKQWMKYSRGPGEMRARCIEMLPDHKLAFGGVAAYGDAVFEGFHTNVPSDGFATHFTIYDCVKDSVVLCQVNRRGQWMDPPMHFATDRNGNLYFESQLWKFDYVVCGNDTLYSFGDAHTIVYGRYGWGCDTVAQWPGLQHYTLTLNANRDDMGFVSGAGSYASHSQIAISATPYPGHTFERWSDGSYANPRTITLVSDSVITALFAKTEGIAADTHSRDLPHLYPNPATSQVQILGLSGEARYVEILDMTGRTAATFQHTSTLDIAPLPQGSYIVEIHTTDGQVQHLKLVKDK